VSHFLAESFQQDVLMAKDKLISFGEQISEKSLAPRFEFLAYRADQGSVVA
jgi:hypothetical protein